jgi:hypothetical protein
MEANRACDYILNTRKKPKRPPSKGSTGSIKWDNVDSQNRRTLERSSPAVSAVPDLP